MYLCTMVIFFFHEWKTIFSLHIRIIRISIPEISLYFHVKRLLILLVQYI